MNSLYILATPIGNLEDLSFRALRILASVNLIAAEDTRTTRKLLSHYQIHTPLTSFHEHNKLTKIPRILQAISIGDVALVSEAGTPGISDPGLELVKAAISNEIPIIPIPGPSAVVTSLAVSGLDANSFLFLGFLPRGSTKRTNILKSISTLKYTIVIFESPRRVQSTLKALHQTLGNRNISVVREATKLYEEVFHGTLLSALEHFHAPRGEFTIVVEGDKEKTPVCQAEAEDLLLDLLNQGMPAREARKYLHNITGIPSSDIYKTWLQIKTKVTLTPRMDKSP